MKRRNFLTRIVVFLFAITALQNNNLFSQANNTDQTAIKPGDAIRILVYDGVFPTDQNKFISNFHNTEFIVDGYGDIRLLSLGLVHIAGKTPEQTSEMIREKLKPFAKEPVVITIPLMRVTLKGAFGKPGMYRVNPGKSFWELVQEAGGLSNMASLESMYIIRRDEILYKDFEESLYRGTSIFELGVESGDEIIAPQISTISVYTIQRYVSFAMSFVILYFSLQNYRKN